MANADLIARAMAKAASNPQQIKDQNTSTGVTTIKFYTCTAAEYAAISSKDANTIYIVKP